MILTTTCGREFIVDDDDLPRLKGMSYHMNGEYVVLYKLGAGRDYIEPYLHKYLLNENKSVDHIDGDRMNNSKGNLRVATATQQLYNRRPWGAYPPGIWLVERTGRYRVRIRHEGTAYNIGIFGTLEEAISAKTAFEKEKGILEWRRTTKE